MRDQRPIDADHLRLLAIFHFVAAAFALAGIAFLFLHYSLMHMAFADPRAWKTQPQGITPMQFMAIFRWFYVVFGLWFILSGVINVISGFFLRARRHRTFSLVVAGINCLYMPFGTILGIFTILVLGRGSVREMYEARRLG
jgi:hypothetical protein